MRIDKPLIGVLVGPTASGKTEVSIKLAHMLNAEIISADSIQIYSGLDIGSAKPNMEERQGVPHHLMGDIDPSYGGFSVAEFQRMASDRIRRILDNGHYPLVVGGSGLYINAITYPLNFTSVPSDDKLRAELAHIEAGNKGSLHAMLQMEDPTAAARLHPNDTKRIIRALEVLRITGKSLGEQGGDFDNKQGREIPFFPRIVGITLPRDVLYERINQRVDKMIESGLIDEAMALYKNGLDPSLPSMQGLGYRQLFRYFSGEATMAEAVLAIKQDTRRFAKRQITWFKRDKRIVWYDRSEYDSVDELAQAMYFELIKEE